ncbi:phosphatidate cytidylyltransferase [Lutimaribacter marinistellae]|uniref:Phosphatidate cytidylyltransferase n=1 Tax=Lutimaribacter marinistellae TaxID=1820329 RepID=A0ABV7TME0_9RHOB
MSEGRWSDLLARVLSALVLVAVFAVELWLGGVWFEVFVAVVCGIMVWELVRLLDPEAVAASLQLGFLTAAALLLSLHLPALYQFPVLSAPILVGLGQVKRRRRAFAGFTVWIVAAGLGFVTIRAGLGLEWMLWLVCIVVATDVAGYFVGKTFGGPKFWPRVSPKKTWSGTAGGWGAAGLVGLAFAIHGGFGPGFVIVSVLASMASQAGDMAESALKRRVGVKDASNLIPGHGGFLDRFDGMMGAAVFVLVIGVFYVPGGM